MPNYLFSWWVIAFILAVLHLLDPDPNGHRMRILIRKTVHLYCTYVLNRRIKNGAVGARAASRYSFGGATSGSETLFDDSPKGLPKLTIWAWCRSVQCWWGSPGPAAAVGSPTVHLAPPVHTCAGVILIMIKDTLSRSSSFPHLCSKRKTQVGNIGLG
jgi:hypothetical protein